MAEPNWEEIARTLLQQAKTTEAYLQPKPIGVLVTWKQGTYFGHIQIIAPDCSKEIVALSKTSNPIPDGLVAAIRKLDHERLNLLADDSIDLEGRNHVLRRLEDRLTIMTPGQTRYMINNPPQVYEIPSSQPPSRN